jgi:site-specific recombinase XerD
MITDTNLQNENYFLQRRVKILFCLQRRKRNSKGIAPIYVRITLNGIRAELLVVSIPVVNWVKGEIQGDTENLLFAKQKIEFTKNRIREVELNLLAKGENVTSGLIKAMFYPKPVYKPSLLNAFKDFLKNKHSLIGIDINEYTYSKYVRVYNYLKTFLKQNYNRSDLEFTELKAKLGLDFFHYMRTIKKCSPAYSSKLVTILKAVVDFSIIEDYTQTNPLKALSFKAGARKEVVYLSIEQLKKLINTEFEAKALNMVKDCFLFQCYTGLAYVDLCNFSTEHIQVDGQGKMWIIISRTKTGGRSTIPILPEAKSIIEKYTSIDKYSLPYTSNKGLLPVFSNQAMNRLLKQIGLITGIGAEVMCTHSARKTFATTALNTSGVSIETVSAMLGHANIKMTQQHYARVNQTKIGNEMNDFKFLTT